MKLLNQIVLLIALFSVVTSAAQRIVVDSDGVMLRADNGDEVSFYGVNYTVAKLLVYNFFRFFAIINYDTGF